MIESSPNRNQRIPVSSYHDLVMNMKPTQTPIFGINIDPSVSNLNMARQLAQIADASDVELVTIQDHPYNLDFLDTWSLLVALAAGTERVRFTTNMLNTPLRPPPAILAKMAASLDLITNGRIELGLGAGGYIEGMQAWGGIVGESRSQRFEAFKEYLEIVRGVLDTSAGEFSYRGEFYRVGPILPGPAPAHRIPLWIGAGGPRMLRLTGKLADGWLIGTIYVLPEALGEVNRCLDEGAASAMRSPSDVRRGYNLFGAIKLHPDEHFRFNRPGLILGTPAEWIETMVHFHKEYHHDTFIFWPVAGDEANQTHVFLQEIMPEVRKQIIEIQRNHIAESDRATPQAATGN